MFRIWWQKFFSFPRNRFSRRRGYRPPLGLVRRTTRLSITALEDRITPAFNLSISSAATVGMTQQLVANTVTFTATASGANLNFNDLGAQLNAGHSVVVDSGSTGSEPGNITCNGGFGTAPISPNTGLTLQSGSGANLVGDIINPNFQLNSATFSITYHAHH